MKAIEKVVIDYLAIFEEIEVNGKTFGKGTNYEIIVKEYREEHDCSVSGVYMDLKDEIEKYTNESYTG